MLDEKSLLNEQSQGEGAMRVPKYLFVIPYKSNGPLGNASQSM
jgi:hypothetical protein